METDLKVVKAVLDVVKDSVPEDCRYIVEEISKKIMRDIRDKGLDKAIMEWYGLTEEDMKMLT